MGRFGIAIAVVLSFAGLVSANAQSVLDGPLAAPGTPPSGSTASKKAKKTPRRTVATTHADPVTANETTPRHLPVVTRPSSVTPDDPLSLGMKWNGSNDNGSQTRVQNYNGNAAGTGAKVGLKLHF